MVTHLSRSHPLWLLPLIIFGIILASCTPGSQPAPTLAASPAPATPVLPTERASTPTSSAAPTRQPDPTPSQQPSSPTPSAASSPISQMTTLRFSPWELVSGLAWSPDGEILAVAAGDHVYLFNTRTWEQLLVLDTGSWPTGLAFSPAVNRGASQHLLALSARDGSVQLWEAGKGHRIASLQAHPKGANSIAFSPDGYMLASTGNDAIVRLWDMACLMDAPICENPLVAELIGGAYAVSDIEFSPDGSFIASVDVHSIRLREVNSQRLIKTLPGETSIFSLAIHPLGRYLAAAEVDAVVRLWDLEGDISAALPALSSDQTSSAKPFVWSLDFSPDGRLLAAGTSDAKAYLWDLSNPNRFWEQSKTDDTLVADYSLLAHQRAVTSLAFDPSGSLLATGSLDGTVIIWGVGLK